MRVPGWMFIAAVIPAVAIGVSLAAPASAQAAKGQALFTENCAPCHGATLDGGRGPPLKGADFLSGWKGKTARNLYSRILTTMPASNPGTLSSPTVLALTLYILNQNGVRVTATTPNQLNNAKIGN